MPPRYPSPSAHPRTPLSGPIQSGEPIEVETPSGVPLTDLLARHLVSLEDSARTVLSRLPGGEEVADLFVDSDQYLWVTGAVLVTVAAGYAARPHRRRAGDRVTLGTDSVVADREDERRGERSPP